MDKDENMFDNQIDEDDDLLNISLDDLSISESDEPAGEEPDKDVIDLIDLVEKGDADLLGIDIDDDRDVLEADDFSFEKSGVISDEDTEKLTTSDLDMGDDLTDSDMTIPDNDLEEESDYELDELFAEDSLDDLGIDMEENDNIDDELEKLLEETELEEFSTDEGFEFDETEDLNLPMEAIDESSESDQAVLTEDETTDESAAGDSLDDLFEDIGLEEEDEENILEPDDELSEESLLESDLQSEATDIDELIDTSDVNFDEIDNIPLDGESIGELLSDSGLEETVSSRTDSGYVQDLMTDEGNQPETEDKSPDVTFDDALKDTGADESLFSEESEGSVLAEESVDSDDFPDDITEKPAPVGEDLSAVSDEDLADEADVQTQIAPDSEEVSPLDASQSGEEIPAGIPGVPKISEEKVEEIVRDVVGEVVEKIAREVFTEVAEKVITEAIDSLKKSLEPNSE